MSGLRVTSSALATSLAARQAPIVAVRASDNLGYHPTQRAAQVPLYWPRYDPRSGQTRMQGIRPDQVPAHWQSVQFHIPGTLVTCAEIDCPMFLRGWTEIVPPDGSKVTPKAGVLSVDEAAQITGYFGAAGLPPKVVNHPPGTPCPRIHKQAGRIPAMATVNGRPVLWNELEDALGGGVHVAQQLVREGRY